MPGRFAPGLQAMPFDAREFRLTITKSLVDAGNEAFKENIRVNALLDDKAQKTAGLAGAFLAAVVAFMKIDSLSAWPFNRLRVLIPLLLTIILLISCVGYCLAVIWARRMPGLPSLALLNKFRNDLSAIPDAELEQYEDGYWDGRREIWQRIIDAHVPYLSAKSARLSTAQLLLACSMLVVGFMLLVIVGPVLNSHLNWRI